MNKKRLKETVGKRLRIQPRVRGRYGSPLDGQWLLESVSDTGVLLRSLDGGVELRLNHDHVREYATDATGVSDGFLVLNAHVQETHAGAFDITPIVPREGGRSQGAALTQAHFGELASMLTLLDEALREVVREAASEDSRERLHRAQDEVHNWVAKTIGPAEAAAFLAAPPDPYVPSDFPRAHADLHQSARGRLTYLIQLHQRLADPDFR